jgi:capsular exopolysaccharide synthesis family protein
VTQLPARREYPIPSWEPEDPEGAGVGSGGGTAGDVWGILTRNRWLIVLCAVAVTAGSAFFTLRETPIYEASAALRLAEKESTLPEIFRRIDAKGAVETEAEVLRSRTLSEEATDLLALRLRLIDPARVARDHLFSGIKVSTAAPDGSYQLTKLGDGRFDLTSTEDKRHIAYVSPGAEVRVNGIAFALLPEALRYRTITFVVRSRAEAASDVASTLSVTQPSRDGQVIDLLYADSDPELVWRVPNAVVSRYVARRQSSRKSDARAMVQFLQDQIDRVAGQMAAAEDTFRSYRERAKVIAPDIDASSQVTRLVSKESERSSIDAERQALARSLDEVTQAATTRRPGSPSPYRRLIGLPFLLRNQAAGQLLSSLASVEDQRTSLLLRRTPEDADVKVLDTRIDEIETQLYGIATTYLRGLTNQVSSLDAALAGFDRQLEAIPRKQLEYARLARKSKGFEEVYTLLQTRLKEAEIVEAGRDATIEIVDTAVAPLWPARPRVGLNILGGLVTGVLLGLAGAFARERVDRSVHTRKDVLAATGLPVLGLIPHIVNGRGRIALITQQRKLPADQTHKEERPRQLLRPRYTFLNSSREREPGGGPGVGASAAPRLHLVVANPGNAVAEAFGILQTNLSFARPDRPVKSIVLTSPLSGDGKTTNAVNLALSVAERGLRTLLIDADLRRGAVHAALQAPREPGLCEVLSGSASLQDALHTVAVGETRTLHFLTAGRSPQSPTQLLESEAMRSLMLAVAHEYDFVILDAPPVNIVTDAALIGAMVDGVLVVARAGSTDAAALAHGVQQLRHVRAPILGVLLNDIDFKRDASYDGAYRYYNYEPYMHAGRS